MISCIAFPRKISLRGGLLGSTAISCGLAAVFVAGLATPLAAQDLTWDSDPATPGIQSDSGEWEQGGSNTNWQNGGGGNTSFNAGSTAVFSDLGGGNATITIQDDIAPGGITFESGGYVVDSADAEDRIEVHGPGIAIDVSGGTSTIAAGISNKSTITVGGGGTLVLSGANTDEGTAAAGTYRVVNGTLRISGSTAAEDSIEVSNAAGTLVIAGTASIGGTVTLDDGTVNGDGGTVADVIVNDGTLNVNADTTADNVTNAGGDVLIETSGVTLTTDFNQTGGETRIADGGVLADSDGVVTISGGELQNNGGGTVSSDVAVSGGTLTASGGTFDNDVTVSGSGTFNVDANTSVGTTTITGGDIDIANGATLNTQLVQSGGTTMVNPNGQLDNAGAAVVDLSGGMLINQGTVADDIELTGDGTLVADGGVFIGDITMLGGDSVFDVNASTLIVSPVTITNGTLNINGTSTLTNDIDLGNGTVNVGADATLNDVGGTNLVAGTLANAGTVTQQVTVSDGGSLDIAGGTFTNGVVANGGNILISENTALDLTNNGSDIVIESGQTLTDDVVNNSGTLTSAGTIAGTLQITGGTVTQNAADTGDPVGGVTGAVTVSGTGQLIANSGEFGAGITAQADGDVEIGGPVSGDVTNDGGTVTITGTGDLDGDLTNTDGNTEIQTNGQLNGDLIVNGGSVTTDGTITGDGGVAGAVEINGGTLTTTGNSEIQDTTTVAGGTLQANGGSFGGAGIIGTGGNLNVTGDVSGDISVQGSDLAVTGTLTGDVTMAAGATVASNSGTINGMVTATIGTFQNSGNIANVTVDGGRFEANGGSVSGAITVTDMGDFLLTANSSGDVFNGVAGVGGAPGGTVTITSGLTLDGNVTNNSSDTVVDGTIDGTLDVNGGTVTTAVGSAVTGLTTVTDGTLNANGGAFGGITATGGTTTVDGTITIAGGALLTGAGGDVDITTDGVVQGNVSVTDLVGTADLVTNEGEITGQVSVSGTTTAGEVAFDNQGTVGQNLLISSGVAQSSGTITGGVDVSGTGDFTLLSGSINGSSAVTGGTFRAEGGSFSNVTNNAGDVIVKGTVAGDINNADGTFTLGVIGGATATLTGDLVNRGIANLNGTLDGETLNTGSNAEMTVALEDEANFGSTSLTNTDAATLTIAGNASGTITNTSTGIFELTGGKLTTGTIVNNAGQMTVSGNATADGTVENTGTLTIGDGVTAESLSVTGSLTNAEGGTLEIAEDATASASTLLNADGGTVELRGRIGSAFTNNGTLRYIGTSTIDDPETVGVDETAITAADLNRFGGLVTNNASGTIVLESGYLRFGNGLANSGTVDTSSGQVGGSEIGDVVEINGALSGGGRFVLDLDLSEENVNTDGIGASDYVDVTGAVSGPIILQFNILATGGAQDNDILVFQSSTPGIDLTMEGLPDPGEAIVYVPYDDGAGSWFVQDALNPGIGALAGSIVLTQSLIGSVINRPSSPFVSGLAYDDPDPCGPGVWTRAIGGEADSSGKITELEGSSNSFDGEISADFWGIQGGSDLACFNGYFKGWDISIGGIGGFNSGSTSQPVFGLVGSSGGELQQGNEVTSITDVDFDQSYAGVYVTGAVNRFSADLQYRLEQTDFVANNTGQNGSSGLGLSDESFSSQASTFSGSVSYAIPLGESSVTFVPTGGFAYTQVSTDAIDFDDGSSVQVEDFTSETVFVGGTLARTSFSEDGTSALSQFGTVTYYSDLADAPRSVFTPAPAADPTEEQPSRSLETENLGSYAELSAGLNYIRILPLDAPGGAKQLSASLRGDLRSSDQLDSWGVTGQFRIQF